MEESIYGKRSGFLPGLAITSRAKILVLSHLRHKVSINSCAELCANGDAGDSLILVSKGSNAFLQGKEMCTAKFIQGRDAVNCNIETLILPLCFDSL